MRQFLSEMLSQMPVDMNMSEIMVCSLRPVNRFERRSTVRGRTGKTYSPNGKRECARRMRQMAKAAARNAEGEW